MTEPLASMGQVRTDIAEALTTICGRCNGKGTESWQRTGNPADGREDWPCNRCKGAGTLTDHEAMARVMGVIGAHFDSPPPDPTMPQRKG